MLGCTGWIWNLITCRKRKRVTSLAVRTPAHPDYMFIERVHTHLHVSVGYSVILWDRVGEVKVINKYVYQGCQLVWFAWVEWEDGTRSWELVENLARIEKVDDVFRMWDM